MPFNFNFNSLTNIEKDIVESALELVGVSDMRELVPRSYQQGKSLFEAFMFSDFYDSSKTWTLPVQPEEVWMVTQPLYIIETLFNPKLSNSLDDKWHSRDAINFKMRQNPVRLAQGIIHGGRIQNSRENIEDHFDLVFTFPYNGSDLWDFKHLLFLHYFSHGIGNQVDKPFHFGLSKNKSFMDYARKSARGGKNLTLKGQDLEWIWMFLNEQTNDTRASDFFKTPFKTSNNTSALVADYKIANPGSGIKIPAVTQAHQRYTGSSFYAPSLAHSNAGEALLASQPWQSNGSNSMRIPFSNIDLSLMSDSVQDKANGIVKGLTYLSESVPVHNSLFTAGQWSTVEIEYNTALGTNVSWPNNGKLIKVRCGTMTDNIFGLGNRFYASGSSLNAFVESSMGSRFDSKKVIDGRVATSEGSEAIFNPEDYRNVITPAYSMWDSPGGFDVGILEYMQFENLFNNLYGAKASDFTDSWNAEKYYANTTSPSAATSRAGYLDTAGIQRSGALRGPEAALSSALGLSAQEFSELSKSISATPGSAPGLVSVWSGSETTDFFKITNPDRDIYAEHVRMRFSMNKGKRLHRDYFNVDSKLPHPLKTEMPVNHFTKYFNKVPNDFNVFTEGSVRDAIKISSVKPIKDPTLRPYQAHVVAIHSQCENGFLNAMSVGLGKTVTTLKAHELLAEEVMANGGNWRSLIVVPPALRGQWVGETGKFFPDAIVKKIEKLTDINKLAAWHAEGVAENKPMEIICSTKFVASHGDAIYDEMPLNEIVIDEGTFLKNPKSKQSKAAWELRKKVDRGVILTGTPIDTQVSNVFGMLDWCIGDGVTSKKLLEQFEQEILTDPDVALVKIIKAMGPLLVRYDRSEIKDDLPDIDSQTILLTPTAAETKLGDACAKHVGKMVEDFQELVNINYGELSDEAKIVRKESRGLIMGGITIARQAASDPKCLLDSESALVALLETKHLISAATKHISTKAEWAVDLCEEIVANKEKVLIFSEFSKTAVLLKEYLEDEDMNVAILKGGQNDKIRNAQIDEFKTGDADIMIITKVGETGLNLQNAHNVINYDLPWTLEPIIQRIGRTVRLGNNMAKVTCYTPIMQGSIEERVADKLLQRAMVSVATLDLSRDVDFEDTEVGKILKGLGAASVSELTDATGNSLLAFAKQVFA